MVREKKASPPQPKPEEGPWTKWRVTAHHAHPSTGEASDEQLRRYTCARIGETSGEQLQWLVDKTRPEAIESLRPDEAGSVGDDLRAVTALAIWRVHGIAKPDSRPMKLAELTAYLTTIGEGIRGIFAGRAWPLPAAATLTRDNVNRDDVEAPVVYAPMIQFVAPDEAASILWGAAQLCAEVGDLLRPCKTCSTVYVALRRQQRHCSTRCIDAWGRRERTPVSRKRGAR
jgi:hypothetical protein